MGYIYSQDYLKQIQSPQLIQLQTGNASVLSAAELAAVAEVRSYLVQKYLIDQELTNTGVYNPASQYFAQSRVYLDAPIYNTGSSYTSGQLATYSGSVYICTTSTTGAFDPTKWTGLGAQYTLFYGAYPNPLFDLYAQYNIGDQVFYNGRTYKALQKSIVPVNSIQYGSIENVPYPNVFPGNPNYWQDMGTYSIPVANNITNTDYWTQGDNRNQQLLMYTIDISLYHLHSRIAPNNIPELRQNRYDDAKAWLRMAGQGDITADISRIQPKTGSRIRFGGSIKNVNSY